MCPSFPPAAPDVSNHAQSQEDEIERTSEPSSGCIRLFTLPPRSPKLNGAVERAQRTHTGEFYEVVEFSLDGATLNQELRAWEHVYNTVRPHQALDYLTPHQFVAHWQRQREEAKCH